MRWVLFLLSIVALIYAIGTNLHASSAIHQILAGIGFVVSAVLLVGAVVLDALGQLVAAMKDMKARSAPKEPEPIEPVLTNTPARPA